MYIEVQMTKKKRTRKTKSTRFNIYMPPAERAFIAKWIGDLNWSEMCCQMLMQKAEEAKAKKEM